MQELYQTRNGACLLVGNAPNLEYTPPEWFDMPAIGMNTIVEYDGWMPDYYVAVDQRVWREFGEIVNQKYRVTPKFMPSPHLDMWQGENIYRFYHRPHELWNERHYWTVAGTQAGFAYHSAMHVAMQIAAFLGYTTLLMIGVQHGADGRQHFWGTDTGMPVDLPVKDWLRGYAVLTKAMSEQGIAVRNLSVDTCVPDDILPRDDWRDYVKS